MPVRHLDFYTTQKNLISVQPLSTLKDIRLGIDGNVWLKKIISQAASEQFLAGIGGTPSCMRKAIEKELEGFKAASIHPLFVFSGLALIRKDKSYVNDDPKISKRNAAWDAVNAGKMELALSSWNSSYVVHQPDLIHLVIRILKENNIDYMRAPYGAGAQLVYLERNPKQIINATYAGSELLMFDIDRVITSIDFTRQTFSVISKKAVLQDLMLSDDQFLDLCILAGFDYCPTFPPLATEGVFALKSIHDLLQQHRNGFNAVKAYAESSQIVKSNYVDQFCRTRCAMRHQPILTDEGHVEPMNVANAPSDIHEFIGYRLPDEVYYYLSRGVITEPTLNSILSGNVVEFSPLCNGETKEYRNFLTTDIMKMRAHTVALLRAHLIAFYHERKISIVYWFENSSAPEHILKPDPAFKIESVSQWKAGKRSILKDLKQTGMPCPDYAFCLDMISNPSEAAATILPKNAEKPAPLATMIEVQGRHLTKLLQLRGFIEPNHQPSAYGKSIVDTFKIHTTAPHESQDALFLALELVRAELLTSRPYSHNYTKKAVLENQAATKAIRLVTRTASLISARFKGVKPWAGPLSRDLLAFNSVNKALTRGLRHLSEAVLLEMLLGNECQKDTLDFTELAAAMPFAYEPSTVLGILVKEYLETLSLNALANNNKLDKDLAIQQVEEHIGATSLSSLANTVKEELQRGFAFWEVVCDAVKSLAASNAISKELAQEFQEANNWTKSRKI